MHPAQEELLGWFEYTHLENNSSTQHTAIDFHNFANYLMSGASGIGDTHGAEVTTGLRKLLEAKDCFVRATLP